MSYLGKGKGEQRNLWKLVGLLVRMQLGVVRSYLAFLVGEQLKWALFLQRSVELKA